MARENQGLQIALIIFVMLTLVLGVTTFLFFKQQQEEAKKAETAQTNAGKEHQAALEIAGQCDRLKEYLGFSGMEQLEEFGEQFNQDMQDYGGDAFPQENRNYHKLLEYLSQEKQQLKETVAALEGQIKTLQKDKLTQLALRDQQVAGFQTEAQKHHDALMTVKDTTKQERARITKENAGYRAQLDEAQKQAAADRLAMDETLKKARDRMDRLILVNNQQKDTIKKFTKGSFDVPDGEIRWVNQRNGTVWINLGRADALSRQVSFSVYPIDTTNLTQAGKKASIEVTQILGEHLAEARVVEDKIADPIMPGDKIHTPVWAPGTHKRFALTGFMDIDGDGKSDQHLVRNLITMNGGIVDCETDAEGNKHGKITEKTRYLVLGEKPDANSPPGVIKGYGKMIDEANEYGIQKISLGDLLQQMGWKNQTPVIRFGRGANPKDFRAKPPEGIPQVSRGNVSEVFKPRHPPSPARSGRGGAY